MSPVISVEHPCPERSRRVSKSYRLGQVSTRLRQSTRRIGTPSRARPLAALGMLREGETAGAFSRDLEAWWAKLCGAWRPIPCCALAKLTTLDGYGIIVCMESEK